MPAGSRGPNGYPDWQRQAVSIAPTLSKQTNSIRFGPTFIGPLYVANFAGFTGTLLTGGEPMSAGQSMVRMEWFTDKQLSQSAGIVEFILKQFILERQYQFLLPNQGAWVRVLIQAIGEGSQHNCGWNLTATNREQLNVNPPLKPTLLAKEGALGNGGELTFDPEYDFAGPVLVSFRGSKPGVLLHLSGFNVPSGASEALATHQTTEEGVYEEFTWLAPLGSWQAKVKNQSGVEVSYAFQMTPAVSGSG